MSESFWGRVRSVEGPEVVFDLLRSTAAGIDDLATSRSFGLVLLHDAMRNATAEQQRRRAKSRASALHAELAKAEEKDHDCLVSRDWMRENVGRFVKWTAILTRRNDFGFEILSERERQVEKEFGGVLETSRYHEWQPRRWELCHNYTLRVVVTDPKWAAHLEPNVEFGTTAREVWPES